MTRLPDRPSSRVFLSAALLLSLACKDMAGPPVAAKLVFNVQPTSVVAGVPILPAIQVAVEDEDGHVVTTSTHEVTLTLGTGTGNGTLTGATTVTTQGGFATFLNLRITNIGPNYTLFASAPGLTGATSATFAVAVGPPASLGFINQPGTATAGVALSPILVEVRDAAGNPVPSAGSGVAMTLGTFPVGATLTGTSSALVVSGVATFSNLLLTKAGTGYTLLATYGGLPPASSQAFAVAPGPPGRLIFTSEPAGSAPGTPLEPAPAVTVLDLFANPVPVAGIPVTLAIGTNPSGGVLSGVTTVNTVGGVATFPGLSINTAGVGYTLAASATGLAGAVTTAFALRNPLILAAITAGYFHSCGLAPGGAAHCWGDNGGGQLGNPSAGSTTLVSVPVTGGLTFATLTAGRTHTCGVTAAGVAYCWGDNALGAGAVGFATAPVLVSGGLTFASVVAGYAHSCGVTVGGAGYCWGDNFAGQLGNNTTVGSTVPVPVAGGLTFASISPGRDFTCGRTVAGAAYCWGVNASGELGDGTTTNRLVPTPVINGLVFSRIEAGGFHACGLTINGAAWCWGSDGVGQVGSGSGGNVLAPNPVSGGLFFASISTGNRHTCAVTAAGAGYCWGENGGMLGNGNTTNSVTPAPVSGGLTFSAIRAGRFHTCGVTTANASYCWGAGFLLGNGSDQVRLVPTRVF